MALYETNNKIFSKISIIKPTTLRLNHLAISFYNELYIIYKSCCLNLCKYK